MKDRAALAMVLDGERRGLLTQDKILIDATSGNTGIAYAMICAERGYRVKLALPKNASHERKQNLHGVRRGAGPDRPDRGHRRRPAATCKQLVDAEPGQVLLPRPVQQRRQLAGPLRDDRHGDLAADARAGSRTSSPAWARAARSWASPGG